MNFDYSLAAVVAAGLLCYLIHALLRPERFWRRKSLPLDLVSSGMPTWSRLAPS
jgi:K+-transporting ATPase KdpF subunit